MAKYSFLFLIVTAFLSPLASAQGNPELDATTRARVIEGVAAQIEDNFYDSDTGARIAAELRENLVAGDYDAARDAASLSGLLTETLSPHDNHFAVRYFGPPSDEGPATVQGPQSPTDLFDAGRRDNFGFREVSILPGNVGYIDMRQFFPVQAGGDTAIAALNFVKNTDAVIFDMRQNGGGAPSMVQLLISHFLDPTDQVPINTFLSSNRDYPGELVSLGYLPAGSRPDVPLYVLTSGRSGSAGEAFPYHLQAMERATIVGETTYGAGNPGGFFPAAEGFGVFVSTSQTRNPITGTNWEGVGVEPDIAVPANDALDTALSLAYGAILETVDDPGQRQSLEWAQEAIDARLNPSDIDVSQYDDVLGRYGPRELFVEGGALFYRRGEQPGRQLTPLGDDRFLIDGLDDYRLTIQRDNDRVVSMALQQAGGPSDVSARDE